MQKWEYLTLDKTVTTGGALVIRVNGKDIGQASQFQDRKYPGIHEFLNQLGDQGWELTGIDDGLFVFRRPKVATAQPRPAEASEA